MTSTNHSGVAASPARAVINNAGKLPGHSAPPLDWRQIESADYRQYVANLRASGCPEQTVRDIIVADLNQLYAPRARAIWQGPAVREFWQKPESRRDASSDQIERLNALGKEKQSVLEQLIGSRVNVQELATMLLMQPDPVRIHLAFLPDDKREAAYRALSEANLASVSHSERAAGGQQVQDREVAALSGILSPDELEEYRMRTSSVAGFLRSELQYFEATPEEFRSLVKYWEEMYSNTNAPNDYYANKTAEAAAFSQLFGEVRGQEYAQKADPFYLWARRAAERYGLPDDAPGRAWEIKRDAITVLQQLRADTTLTAGVRRQQVEALHRTTEAKLVEVLGTKGTAMAKLGDAWLQFPNMEMGR